MTAGWGFRRRAVTASALVTGIGTFSLGSLPPPVRCCWSLEASSSRGSASR